MDAFSDALRSMHVAGQIVLAERYAPPWAIRIPDGAALKRRMALDAQTAAAPFHIAKRGGFRLTRANGDEIEINAGEAVICLDGAQHVMARETASGGAAEVVLFEDILDGAAAPADQPEAPDATELVCGVFALRRAERNPLFSALPPMVKLGVLGDGANRSLSGIAELLTLEAQAPRRGEDFVASRLVQLFCAEALRAFVETAGDDAGRWVRGLTHPKIGAALNALHGAPAAAHSVASLAAGVGMSPSRFAAVFTKVMGAAPMRYLQSLRLEAAAALLEESDLSIDEIAAESGYGSLAAFSRAYKAQTGLAPGQARRAARADR
ncbi:MAG: AraC family transcriptional regulator [Pseudomonadota bacterium]